MWARKQVNLEPFLPSIQDSQIGLKYEIRSELRSEVGIYKRKQESKKTRAHAFDQESDQEKKK